MNDLMCDIWYSMKSAWWTSANCLMFDEHIYKMSCSKCYVLKNFLMFDKLTYNGLPKVLCSKHCLMFEKHIHDELYKVLCSDVWFCNICKSSKLNATVCHTIYQQNFLLGKLFVTFFSWTNWNKLICKQTSVTNCA